MQNNMIKKNIHPKQHVAVLLKEDYENGNLTYGIVEDILTKNDTHYRGIKVRLKIENETEEEREKRKIDPDYRRIGRVKAILPGRKKVE